MANGGDLPVVADGPSNVARVEHLLGRRGRVIGLAGAEQRRDPLGDDPVQPVAGVDERFTGTEPVVVIEWNDRRTAVRERIEGPRRVLLREGTLWRAILGVVPCRARRIGLTGLVGLGLRGRREQPDGVDGDVVEPRQLLGQRRRDTRARTAPSPTTRTNASASDGC